jgi:3-oxo-5-beta-steroid 4-dehydrogenase
LSNYLLLFCNHAISFQTAKGTALECVKNAIDVGYRHFDGALVYFNEHEVGQAIREKIADGTVKREDIFYCGKVRLVTGVRPVYTPTHSVL